MKAFMLFTGSGPLVILTSHSSVTDPALLEKFSAKGIDKFIAHEIPLAVARERYAGHFERCDQRSARDRRSAHSRLQRRAGVPAVPALGSRPADTA